MPIAGSLQALNATFPHGITWANPGQLQSPTLLTQNPIYIRSQQSDVFLQPGPQQGATLHALPVAAPVAQAPTVMQQQPQQQQQLQQAPKPKQVRQKPALLRLPPFRLWSLALVRRCHARVQLLPATLQRAVIAPATRGWDATAEVTSLSSELLRVTIRTATSDGMPASETYVVATSVPFFMHVW